MDDAALVGGHRLDGDLSARSYRLVCELLREAPECLLALFAVALAIDDDALIFFPADIGDGACKHLQCVEDLSAVPDEQIGVGGYHIYLRIFPRPLRALWSPLR